MARPRKPGSGGPRVGTVGKPYGNRSDLRGGSVPIQAATGQPYGAAGSQIAAQRAVPLSAPPSPGQPSIGGGIPPQVPPPGSAPFGRPSERPGEPITAGLPIGPGDGPEALGPSVEDQDLTALAAYLPALELLAAQPGSTVTTRNFVRRVRGAMPLAAAQQDPYA